MSRNKEGNKRMYKKYGHKKRSPKSLDLEDLK